MLGGMENEKLGGFPAMKAWDASFRSGHMPAWFKKCVRARYKKRIGGGGSSRECYEFSEVHGDPWDHWGSVQRDGFRAVITQPYGDATNAARKWAEELGCVLAESRKGGPWSEGTWYYEFHPPLSTGDGSPHGIG